MSEATQDILSGDQKNMIFAGMSDGVITVDADGNITYINPACTEILETSEQALLGASFRETFLNNRSNREFNRLFEQCIQKNLSIPRKTVKYHTSSGIKYFNIEISPVNHQESSSSREKFQGMMILIEDVTDAYLLKTQERDCAMIFAGIIVCITVYLSVWSLLEFTLHLSLKTSDYTRMIEGMTLLLFLEIIFFSSFSLKDVGLIPKKSLIVKNMKQTLLIALVACGALAVSKEILLLLGMPVKQHFIGGTTAGAYQYIFTALLQEFLARGVIQTNVKHLMNVRFQTIFGIVLTSLLFMLMHLPFGFIFMMGSFILSIALGILFEQQKSIWGCVFLHWSVGYLAMCLFF